MSTLIIIDDGETETFGDEPEIIDWTFVMSRDGGYELDDLKGIRDTIAQYPGTEEYVTALDEKIKEMTHADSA